MAGEWTETSLSEAPMVSFRSGAPWSVYVVGKMRVIAAYLGHYIAGTKQECDSLQITLPSHLIFIIDGRRTDTDTPTHNVDKSLDSPGDSNQSIHPQRPTPGHFTPSQASLPPHPPVPPSPCAHRLQLQPQLIHCINSSCISHPEQESITQRLEVRGRVGDGAGVMEAVTGWGERGMAFSKG